MEQFRPIFLNESRRVRAHWSVQPTYTQPGGMMETYSLDVLLIAVALLVSFMGSIRFLLSRKRSSSEEPLVPKPQMMA